MKTRLTALVESLRNVFSRRESAASEPDAPRSPISINPAAIKPLLTLAIVGGIGYVLYTHPPMQTVKRGEVGIRINQFTGSVSEWREGGVLVLPALHDLRVLSLRDHSYRHEKGLQAAGPAPFQSLEGLSFGVDLTVRYALDQTRVATLHRRLPDDIGQEIVEPAVQGVIYKTFARYTVRETFSTKRAEIQKSIEAELGPKLANDGIVLKAVHIGQIDLPANYKRGMETLLAEELATEKMRYTLDLKAKQVTETGLEADAEKIRREKKAEAAAREQIIAAKAQEEAMKHVLPLKQRQIEQRQLEAEAEKVARIRTAEGSAAARQIEAKGEAEARQKLADAEVYRLDKVGKTNAEQMQREGKLVTAHPLLIQKTMADKLSDKIQVVIAPPGDGAFIGAALLGIGRKADKATELAAAAEKVAAQASAQKTEKEED